MSRLGWGRRFLMCRPEFFDVAYEINPYMHVQVHPDADRAREQFAGLVRTLEQAGATVEFMDAVDELPDMVFTANAGIVDGERFVPSRFRHPERQGETPHDRRWFEAHGWRIVALPGVEPFEGAGDALPFGGPGTGDVPTGRPAVLVAGYRTRTAFVAHERLGEVLGVPVRSVELADERYYHIDLVFCPLDGRHALVAPQGLDRYGCKVVEQLVPEPLWLEDEEAEAFCANSVVVDDNIVMPSCTPRLGRVLESIGLHVSVAPVDEFLKAGGGCRCLTLALDMALGGDPRR